MKQAEAQRQLQFLDLAGEGRLGEMQAFGGAGDRTGLGNRCKTAQQAQVWVEHDFLPVSDLCRIARGKVSLPLAAIQPLSVINGAAVGRAFIG